MNAIREFIKLKNNELHLKLPKEFANKEVEVIVLEKGDYEFWSEEEIKNIGKTGFISSSFEEDEEDYILKCKMKSGKWKIYFKFQWAKLKDENV